MSGPDQKALQRQARMVAVVIAVTMILWLGLGWLGGRMGLDPSYAFLVDLAAIAAFLWALVVTWRIKRAMARG
ncbi:DUF5337 family protein [Frigidibacter sp. MR17.24]|uniref:DUF5337 family protein n=1 Tax=Frigidibacter sp. MR17.24 TaxID=3127345 RepID=UPI003012A30C